MHASHTARVYTQTCVTRRTIIIVFRCATSPQTPAVIMYNNNNNDDDDDINNNNNNNSNTRIQLAHVHRSRSLHVCVHDKDLSRETYLLSDLFLFLATIKSIDYISTRWQCCSRHLLSRRVFLGNCFARIIIVPLSLERNRVAAR